MTAKNYFQIKEKIKKGGRLILTNSELDSARFNISVAKVKDLEIEDISIVDILCKDKLIDLLITRIPTKKISLAQELEKNEFLLMDTLVYYKYDYSKKGPTKKKNRVKIISLERNVKNAEIIKNIAKSAFEGYLGHYHSDPKLKKTKADEAYIDWAYRSCLFEDVSDSVIATALENQIVGFGTLKIHSSDLGEIILAAVSPMYQNQGLYSEIILGGMNWLNRKGCTEIILSTQLTNIAVQKVWARIGFEMDNSFYTFHKWFKFE